LGAGILEATRFRQHRPARSSEFDQDDTYDAATRIVDIPNSDFINNPVGHPFSGSCEEPRDAPDLLDRAQEPLM
jgi:hypothetical protein